MAKILKTWREIFFRKIYNAVSIFSSGLRAAGRKLNVSSQRSDIDSARHSICFVVICAV